MNDKMRNEIFDSIPCSKDDLEQMLCIAARRIKESKEIIKEARQAMESMPLRNYQISEWLKKYPEAE